MGKSILIVAGNLGRDPELRYTQTGQAVTNLSIAAEHMVAKQPVTVWWQVTLWGDRAVAAAQHLRKSRFVVAICHSAHARQYVASDGSQGISMDATAWDVIYGPKVGTADDEEDGLALMQQVYAMGLASAAGMAAAAEQQEQAEVSAPPAATPVSNGRRGRGRSAQQQEPEEVAGF